MEERACPPFMRRSSLDGERKFHLNLSGVNRNEMERNDGALSCINASSSTPGTLRRGGRGEKRVYRAHMSLYKLSAIGGAIFKTAHGALVIALSLAALLCTRSLSCPLITRN